MKNFIWSLLIILIFSILLLVEQSDFNLGLEYWRSEGDGFFSWEPVNGHPTGCFRVDDDATGDINRAFAPNKFLGDWSDADGTGTLSAVFDSLDVSTDTTWTANISGLNKKFYYVTAVK